MSDSEQQNPLTDEVVNQMVEGGGVQQETTEGGSVPQVATGGDDDNDESLVARPPAKIRKPRAFSLEMKRTRQFGMYVPMGETVNIDMVRDTSKRSEIKRFTYFHTSDSNYQQQVFIFWVGEPWSKIRCITFVERVGGIQSIFKLNKDKHSTIEKQFSHKAEQKQMKKNMTQVPFQM